jgi:hypothetical protein
MYMARKTGIFVGFSTDPPCPRTGDAGKKVPPDAMRAKALTFAGAPSTDID